MSTWEQLTIRGCVAKTKATGGKVGDCVRLLLSPCPRPTPLSGVISAIR